MKIGLLITARLKSSRLPMKLLMDLNGRSIIERVIDRAKKVAGIDEIVLCTSTNAQDQPLAKVALDNNCYYFLGSEEDVLQRLIDTARFFSLDYIISITGENPLFSLEYANRTVDKIRKNQADFVYFEGLPVGCAVYGIKTKALEVVCKVKQEVDTEIWGPLINRPEIFDVDLEKVDDFYHRPEIRITDDYPEDYRFLNRIFSDYPVDAVPSLFSVLELFERKPEYLEINAARTQLALSPEKVKQINTFYTDQKEAILQLKAKIYAA